MGSFIVIDVINKPSKESLSRFYPLSVRSIATTSFNVFQRYPLSALPHVQPVHVLLQLRPGGGLKGKSRVRGGSKVQRQRQPPPPAVASQALDVVRNALQKLPNKV